ncbi:MAG: creatininase family protein [Natronohydrobacter sp.]|nr:creatininase family protein [Natronohydrobacter sp.]
MFVSERRYWADYTAREFQLLECDKIIAVLPVGAIEQHGPHLPLSVDRDIVDGLIKAAIPLIPSDCHALFLPTCPIGKSDEHARFAGTLTLSAQTLMAMWSEIGSCVANAGVRKLILLNSHGGQIAPLDIVARDLRIRHNMITVAASWFAMGLPEGALDPHEAQHGIHAGEMETAMMLALHPEKVAMEHARDFVPLSVKLQADHALLGLGPGARLGWQAQDLHPAGACGNAAAATLEKGQVFIEHAARQIVTLLREVDALPLSVLENSADPSAR